MGTPTTRRRLITPGEPPVHGAIENGYRRLGYAS